MPESRNRQKHHPHQPIAHHEPAKPKRSAAFVLAILAAILGLAVVYFSQGVDALWMVIGATLGAALGYTSLGTIWIRLLRKTSNVINRLLHLYQ